MYVDLTVPPIEKRHSEPFAGNQLAVPQGHQSLTACNSAPDLSSSAHQLFREFCSEVATAGTPTPRSSPSRSGTSSASASPKRSPPSGSAVPQRRCSTAVSERRTSIAPSISVTGGPAIGATGGNRQRKPDDDFDGWLEFYHKRVPPPRKNSFLSPNTGGYRCRSFSITTKGSVLNLGEVLLADSSRRRSTGSCNERSDIQLLTQRVRLVGAPGVGKSCLVEQFKDGFSSNTNEFGYLEIVTSPPPSAQCSLETQSTKILLDGEEFDIDFDELLNTDVNIDSVSRSDAFVVVYSVTDRTTFEAAEDTLKYLRRTFGFCRGGAGKRRSLAITSLPGQQHNLAALQAKPIILAGNKADLARKRTVSMEEGRSLAKRFDCRFLETSACIGHNVDELLVETLKQIRLLKRRSSSLPGWSLSFPAKFVACSEPADLQPPPLEAISSPLADDGCATPTAGSPGSRSVSVGRRSAARTFCFKARGLLQRFWTRCDSGRTLSYDDLDVL